MSERESDKKGGSWLQLLLVPIVVALVAGGTSPWWWKDFKELVGNKPQAPLPTPSSPQASSSPSISPSTSPSPETSSPSSSPSANISIPPLPPPTPFPTSVPTQSVKTPAPMPTKDAGALLISWSKTVNNLGLRNSIGLQFSFQCPPSRDPITRLYGTDIYTGHSSICEAAVHSGAITQEQGGTVTIKVYGDQQSFVGSQKSGVLSKGLGRYYSSFIIIP